MDQKPVEQMLEQPMEQNIEEASRIDAAAGNRTETSRTDAAEEASRIDAASGNGTETSRRDAGAGNWTET